MRAAPAGRRTRACRRSRARPSRADGRPFRPSRPCRGAGSRCGRASALLYETVHVVIADPPAYTPWYDHELATALARAGALVEVATSRFRFANLPPAHGYRRVERLFPPSARGFPPPRARPPPEAVGPPRRLGPPPPPENAPLHVP